MNLESSHDKLKMENIEPFDIMIIPPSKISQYDYNHPNYLEYIFNNIEIKTIKPENFALTLAQYTDLNKYKTNNMGNNIFGYSKNYCYNIIYLELNDNDKEDNIKNEVGILLNNCEGDLYGNCLIFKTYIPQDSYIMKFENIIKQDLINLLKSRATPKMVIYDGEFYEKRIGNIDKYSKELFGEEYIKKEQVNFYNHNLNFWYTISDYGIKICPNLINKKIDQMICFSTFNIYKDDFSLEELNKIIALSNKKIEDIDIELFKQDTDNLGRKIIKSKFRILEMMFKKYI